MVIPFPDSVCTNEQSEKIVIQGSFAGIMSRISCLRFSKILGRSSDFDASARPHCADILDALHGVPTV